MTGMGALKITFRLPDAQSSMRLIPPEALSQIPDQPQALGLWLRDDGAGLRPYLRFIDSTGQVFEEGGIPLDWQGWRYVLILMNTALGSHWGGAGDGVIHYPIRWDSLLVVKNGAGGEAQSTLYLSGLTLIYGAQ